MCVRLEISLSFVGTIPAPHVLDRGDIFVDKSCHFRSEVRAVGAMKDVVDTKMKESRLDPRRSKPLSKTATNSSRTRLEVLRL
jgi:hypothetical protein